MVGCEYKSVLVMIDDESSSSYGRKDMREVKDSEILIMDLRNRVFLPYQ